MQQMRAEASYNLWELKGTKVSRLPLNKVNITTETKHKEACLERNFPFVLGLEKNPPILFVRYIKANTFWSPI